MVARKSWRHGNRDKQAIISNRTIFFLELVSVRLTEVRGKNKTLGKKIIVRRREENKTPAFKRL